MWKNFTEILFLIIMIVLAIVLIITCVYSITDDDFIDVKYLIYDYNDIRIAFEIEKIDSFYEEGGEYFWEYDGIGYSAPEDKIEFSGKE